ncbi:ead/Ea22-like family protein [Enterobacter cloacae]|uniref:ead/Ea22-like family protein n=5 Tax=Enterobacter cloacae TaxID=550 RepID=UPI001C399C92|nr:ead/Ea22-like family protein [Enterobacter cloacae]MDE7904134.1 ead/Ea22-like family protein [Enterobacter cloacae]HBH6927461.1 ead/Ea22-like family protein [Enterobacter cloacae]
MSNIDKRALREAAERATPGNWWIDSHGQAMVSFIDNDVLEVFATDNKRAAVRHEDTGNLSRWRNYNDATFIATADPATVLALLDEMEAKDKQIVELQALARGVKQYSEFQICHYGATEDYAKGYIDCQNNYNKVLFAAAGKGE